MLTIRPLSVRHDRSAFDCGVAPLNDFLRKTARQHREKGLSNTFVLLHDDDEDTILGFFTLSFLEVDVSSLPAAYSRRLPKSSRLPGAKLARLAVGLSHQKKGYGAIMVADAVNRILTTATESAAIVGLFVDAKDDAAKRFYERFGFITLHDSPLSLFLPLETLLKGLDAALKRG